MSANGGDSETPMQVFELYIKASAIDKETKGSCPICQQFFMMTCLLGENQEDITFKVYTVQADCPPKNFAAGWSKKYPVVMVNSGRNKSGQDISGMMYDTFEDLELFFESINKNCPELKRKNAPNQAAMQVVENVYKHFNHFLSGQSEKGLLGELKKLNEYLEGQDTKFLVDNVLSFADCHLLPRLQHIRVAGKAYRDFDIPKEFIYVWRYLKNAYEQDSFKSTMPSDQDIIVHYEKKVSGPPKKRAAKPTLQKFTYTTEIPEDILKVVGGDPPSQEVEEEASASPLPEPEQAYEQEAEQEDFPAPPSEEPALDPDFGAAEPETAGLEQGQEEEEVAEEEEEDLPAPNGISEDNGEQETTGE